MEIWGQMAKKPTYNQLAQQVKRLEKRVAKLKGAEEVLREKEEFYIGF
jgi:hypothetical protein